MNTRINQSVVEFFPSCCKVSRLAPRALGATCVILALAGAVLAQGCVQAEADIPDMEVTRQDLAIQPGPSASPAGAETTVIQKFKYEKTPTPLPKSVTSKMHATAVTITLKHGAKNLSFIRSAKLTVAEDGGKAETVVVYEPKGDEASGTSISLPLLSSPEALNPWSVDASTFELTVTGILPSQAWYLDVTLSYTGSVSYSS